MKGETLSFLFSWVNFPKQSWKTAEVTRKGYGEDSDLGVLVRWSPKNFSRNE